MVKFEYFTGKFNVNLREIGSFFRKKLGEFDTFAKFTFKKSEKCTKKRTKRVKKSTKIRKKHIKSSKKH
jgi:hypothetical protein